jgi:hypothetical protein
MLRRLEYSGRHIMWRDRGVLAAVGMAAIHVFAAVALIALIAAIVSG